jgi:hypothetical protein
MADAAIWDAQVNKSSTNPDYNRAIKKQGFFLDTHQIVAKRIKNGEPVGDFWLRGKAKEALVTSQNTMAGFRCMATIQKIILDITA